MQTFQKQVMPNTKFFDKTNLGTDSSELYTIIMDSISDGLVVTNIQGVIEFATPQAIKIFSLNDPEEVIGKSAVDFIADEDKHRAAENIKNFFNGIAADDKSYRLKRKGGADFYAEIVPTVLNDERGQPKGLVALIRDITDKKLVELKLREKDEQFRIVVKEAPVVLFVIDANGIFRFSEGKGLEKLGLKPREVIGMSAFDVYKDYPEVCQQVRDALGGKTVHDILHIRSIYFDITYNPIFDNQKRITSLIGIALDITDRYNVESALYESEEKFRNLFTTMSEGMAIHELICDSEGKPINYRILETNPAYEKHTGIGNHSAMGKLGTEVYNTDIPPYLKEFSDVVICGNSSHFDTYFPPLEKYFKISVVPLGKNHFATIFQDISVEKKYIKEIKDKNDELERFTYTVSHDLKSPLVTIKGFIGMVAQDIQDGKFDNVQDDIRRISAAAEKMGDLLNDLLQLSRIGRIIDIPAKVPMRKIIDDTLEILDGIISTGNFTIKIQDNLPEVVVDKKRMAEVWQNLIENAIKFSKNTNAPVIEIGYIKNYGEHLFFIKDNGIGIDPKYHESVFGLFNKLENNTLGTGIGLALVKRIIDVHGGRIWVESEGYEKGTVFKFTLPNKSKSVYNA